MPDTPSQPDQVAAYLAEVRENARIYAVFGEHGHLLVTASERLIGAVEAVRSIHQEHEGRCTHCYEFCTCVEEALPKAGHMAYPDQVHKAAWDGWANCTHGNVEWPCPTYAAITKALLAEDAAP